jgi:methyl-accepting chemotaxis protein
MKSHTKYLWGIQNKLFAILLIITLIPTGILTFILSNKLIKSAYSQFNESTMQTMLQVDSYINSNLDSMKETTKALASDSMIIGIDDTITSYVEAKSEEDDGRVKIILSEEGSIEENVFKKVKNIQESYAKISSVCIAVEENGGYVQWPHKGSRKAGYDPRIRPWYKQAMDNPDEPVITEPYITTAGNATVSSVVVIKDEAGRKKGVAAMVLHLEELTNTIKQIHLGETGYVMLVDKKGTILANPKNSDINLKNINDIEDKQSFNIEKKNNYNIITMNGKQYFAIEYISPKLGWKIIGAIEQSEIEKDARKMQWIMIIVIIVLSVIIFIIAYLVSRQFSQPIIASIEQLKLISTGDFSKKMSNKYLNKRDEFGSLTKMINDMQEEVKGLIMHISQSAEQVAASSEEFAATTEHSSEAVNQISAAMIDLTQGAKKQMNSVKQTTTGVEKISEGVQKIASNIDSAGNISNDAVNAAKKGSDAIDSVINQMNNIEESTMNSANVIVKLDGHSAEISEIVDTIVGIAGQTNMLALNAAIEAARAGEHGKGFAVVAEEVRKLAEQSEAAAKKISDLLIEIRSSTEKAVTVMGEGTNQVKIGKEMVVDSGKCFKDINVLIMNVSSQIQEISSTMQHVAGGSMQIVSNVHEIEVVSKNIADETQNISSASEEQVVSIEEIKSSSEALAQMAQEMQNAINKFSFNK